MKHFYISLIINLLSYNIYAQYTNISGYIKDAETGETLAGAVININGTTTATTANAFGFYNFRLPANDTLNIVVSYIGYKKTMKSIITTENKVVHFFLESNNVLHEVEVVADKIERIDKIAQNSIIHIPIKDIKLMPQLFGESNLLKSLQMLPGIGSGNEGSSGIFVRGGSPDQNLILLDDIPLYYVSHYGGFFSAFNSDALSNVTVIKGGFPAKYGGRLSTVLDIRMKDGNNQKFQGSASIGLLSSKASIQGPIVKGKSSYMLSFRKSNIDYLMRTITSLETGTGMGISFYDLNAKVNHQLSDKNRLYVSFYSGNDRFFAKTSPRSNFGFEAEYNNRWGNYAASTRWNHIFGHRLFSNITLLATQYHLAYTNESSDSVSFIHNEFKSSITDFGAKADFEWNINQLFSLKYGGVSTLHRFNPGIFNLQFDDSVTIYNSKQVESIETDFYAENSFSIRNWFSGNIGFRYSIYQSDNKKYFSWQPRINLRLALTTNLSVKSSYATVNQNLHLLTNSGMGMPTDLWVPATPKASPEQAVQYTLGMASSVFKNRFELSIEAYYKEMKNLIAYSEGTSFFTGQYWEDKIEIAGKGLSKGVEFLLQKKNGNTTGWLAYTLSKTTRQFENINSGNEYLFKYDQTHNFNFVLNEQVSDKWTFSIQWVFRTGTPVTVPVSRYSVINYAWYNGYYDFNSEGHVYNGRNSYRFLNYHRLDVGVTYKKEKKKGVAEWNFSIYNAYGRINPSYYEYDHNTYNNNSTRIRAISLFPFLPSVSYSFWF